MPNRPYYVHMYDKLVCMEPKPEAIDDILWGT